MTKKMLIDAVHLDEARVAIIHDDELYDYDFVTTSKTQLKGNVFLAKITRVEPSLQAAFVEYGNGRQGFLPFSEIHPDYYHMPMEDKHKLLAEQIAEAEAEEAEEEAAFEREQQMREGRRPRHHEEDAIAADDALDPEEDALLGDETAADAFRYALEPQEAIEVHSQPVRHHHEGDDIPLINIPTPDPLLIPQADDASSFATDSYAEENAAYAESDGINPQPDEPNDQAETDADSGTQGGERRRGGRPVAFYRRYRIQEVIRRNQIVLVQVTKEERGNKGCSLTTYVSLAGRYCVLMPNSPKGGGISRKITDRDTRKQLKELAAEMRTHRSMSVIIRTAGIDRSKPEILRDYEYLVKLWNKIREDTLAATAPALIYEEGNLIKRSIRDLYTNDIESIEIEGETAYHEAKDFMNLLMPTHTEVIKPYSSTTPIFTQYGVEEELEEMLEPQVKLPSGGYIVINPTEALISIDVNSGRSTTERNVEETALKTNLEAAREVARQMRLRDLAGIIVIDFIDMNYGKNRKLVERTIRDSLKQDRAKIQLGRISIFGLLELSRQRMRPSISEAMGIPCPHCKGTGVIHSVETVGMQIIRTLQKEAASGDFVTLRVSVPAEIALQLLNEKRAILSDIETRHGIKIIVLIDSSIITATFRLVKTTREGKEVAHENIRAPRRRGRRGGAPARRPRPGRTGEDTTDTSTEDSENNASSPATVTGEVVEPRDSNAARSRRGRRGGKGRRDSREPRTGDDANAHSASSESTDTRGQETSGAGGEEKARTRGGRNRRGGRGRNTPREKTENSAADTARTGNDVVVSFSATQENNYAPQPKPPQVVGLSEASQVPRLQDTPEDPNKPKRKGWWSRVLEN